MTGSSPGPADGVVVHLDEADPAKHEAVLRNITHLLDALGPDTVVELVTHGPGLSAVLLGSPHEEALRELLARGVRAVACANTMRQKGISGDRLVPAVGVVPAGIARLVVRQREGWSYVRP